MRKLMPVYYRLAHDIKLDIESGKLKEGDMIPTEEQLGEMYGISRMTVRQGIALLTETGLIETVKGKGSFVRLPKLSHLTFDLHNTSPSDGERVHYKLLSVKMAYDSHSYVQQLGLAPSDKVILLRRLVYKGDMPSAIEEKYMRYLRGKPLLENQLEYADFPEVVAKHQDSVPVRNEMMVTVDVLSEEQAALLETEPYQPAMIIKQVIYSKDNIPLGISLMVCHKDRFQLNATSYSSKL